MIRLFPGERFKEIPIDVKLQFRYAISNFGRLVSYTDDLKEGRELKGHLSQGYRTMTYKFRLPDGKLKSKSLFLYKLVAEYFCPKTSEDQKHVIHLDYVRDNDHFSNLKWVTREEMLAHAQKSPKVIAWRQERRPTKVMKLTTMEVIRLKKRLLDPNRKTRIKILAKEFGVSEMQLYRIKTGENWGHIKV